MTSPVRLMGIFLVAAVFGHGLTLWALGKSLSALGWVLRVGWLGVGMVGLLRGGAWEELLRESAMSRWWLRRFRSLST